VAPDPLWFDGALLLFSETPRSDFVHDSSVCSSAAFCLCFAASVYRMQALLVSPCSALENIPAIGAPPLARGPTRASPLQGGPGAWPVVVAADQLKRKSFVDGTQACLCCVCTTSAALW
jgi:hypothetical protein